MRVQRRARTVLATTATAAFLLGASACTSNVGTPVMPASGPSSETAEPAASRPADPVLTITFSRDDAPMTLTVHPDGASCTNRSAISFRSAADTTAVGTGTATLAIDDDATAARGALVVDGVAVMFSGRGVTHVDTAADGARSLFVTDLPGTARIVDLPAGSTPAPGEVDFSTATEVAATLTTLIVCPAD